MQEIHNKNNKRKLQILKGFVEFDEYFDNIEKAKKSPIGAKSKDGLYIKVADTGARSDWQKISSLEKKGIKIPGGSEDSKDSSDDQVGKKPPKTEKFLYGIGDVDFKFVNYGDGKLNQIQGSNGSVYNALHGESDKDFKQRAIKEIKQDFKHLEAKQGNRKMVWKNAEDVKIGDIHIYEDENGKEKSFTVKSVKKIKNGFGEIIGAEIGWDDGTKGDYRGSIQIQEKVN